MSGLPEDYDLDTSDGRIVEDGSTIVLFLVAFIFIAIIGVALKLTGGM